MPPFFKDNALNNFLKSSNACHYFVGDPALSLCNLVPTKCKIFESFHNVIKLKMSASHSIHSVFLPRDLFCVAYLSAVDCPAICPFDGFFGL
jgi:hypothetical protein